MKMEKAERERRIAELRRNERISRICKLWEIENIEISHADFLSVAETLTLQEQILEKLDTMDVENTCRVFGEKDTNALEFYADQLIATLNESKEYVFWPESAYKTGAIVLKGKTIIENSSFIINQSDYTTARCIFVCSRYEEKGVCLWTSEYDIRVYVW